MGSAQKALARSHEKGMEGWKVPEEQTSACRQDGLLGRAPAEPREERAFRDPLLGPRICGALPLPELHLPPAGDPQSPGDASERGESAQALQAGWED